MVVTRRQIQNSKGPSVQKIEWKQTDGQGLPIALPVARRAAWRGREQQRSPARVGALTRSDSENNYCRVGGAVGATCAIRHVTHST